MRDFLYPVYYRLKDKKLVFILMFSFFISQLPAQVVITGKIVDGNGNSLSHVSVMIDGLEKGTLTDAEGLFNLPVRGNKTITLHCSLASYLTATRVIDLRTQNHEILISLVPNRKNLEEVIVVSTGSEENRNTSYTVNSVSHLELQKSGQNTLMESLSQKAGVDIISTGGIGKPVIRGLSFNKVALYAMGTKVESQQWDDDHDAGIAEAGLDHAEIIYGPSALIYGADAIGGAVIFTDEKNPAPGKTVGNVNLNLFSNTSGITINAGLRHSDQSGFFYQGYLNNQSHCDYRQGSTVGGLNNYAINSRYNNFSAKGKLGLSKNWGIAKLSYSYLRSVSGLVVDDYEDSVARENGNPYTHNSRKMMSPFFDVTTQIISSENTVFSKNSKWNITAAYQSNKREEFMPVAPGEMQHISLGLLLRTMTYDIKWSSDEEKQLGLTVGSQGMLQFNRNYGTIIATPDAEVNDFALYGVIHYNAGNWKFLAGLRTDTRSITVAKTTGHYEDETTLDSLEIQALNASGLKRTVSDFKRNYKPFNFSVGVVDHATNNLTLKANLATGFSAPNFGELSTFWKHEGYTRFEIGNPNLKSQHNIEGDVNASLLLKSISVSFSAFFNKVKNYIYLAPTRDSLYDLQVIAYSQKDASIYGSEIGVNIHPATIKWLQVNSSFTLNMGKISDGTYLPYFPSNKVMTELKCELDSIGKLSEPYIAITVNHHFAQNKPALYETTTKGYFLLDVNAGTNIKIGQQRIHLVLFCTNIFNTAYYNHLSLLKVIGIYDRGRNIGLKINIAL